jgi:polysaccharide biosynthesis/export protein
MHFANDSKWLPCVVLVFSALILSGCTTYPEISEKESASQEAAQGKHDYLIGPGDTLSVSVWHNPEVSISVPVRPDGKITTPLVEDLQASGKTSSQLARDIEKVLSKYINDPIVTVIVTGIVGDYSQQIRVIGQAAKPQSLSYRDNMTLVDVLIAVGGLTTFADGNAASIVRTVKGKQKQFNVRLNDLIKSGDMSANVPMRPGDVLVIPEGIF